MPTILTGSSLTWNTTFTLNTTPKKFVFLDNNPYTAASIPLTGVKGVFSITSPSGVVVYNNTSYGASSDIVANLSLTNAITIPLPNLANQAPEQGVYTITYSVQITDGSNPAYIISQTRTYDFTYSSPTVSITPQVDCIQPLFTATDATDYVVNSITPTKTRTITLDYPANSGGTPVTNTASATITTSTFYTGLQAVTVSSVLSYTYGTGFYIADTIAGTKSINVDCSYVCQLYCCLKSLRNNVENNRGVNDVEFARWESRFSQAMAQLELLFLAIDCGKQEDANTYISSIKTISNCTDDCSCTDGTPTLVTGLGIQNVNVAVVSGGTPITVTSNTSGGITTYTVTFSAALVSQLSAMYNTVVAAGTNVTITDTGVVSGVRTFTVNAPWSNNVLKDSQWFRCTLDFTSPSTVAITTSNFETTGTNMTNATVTNTGPSGNNLFNVSAFQVVPNDNYKVWIEAVQLETSSNPFGINGASAQYNITQKFKTRILNQQSDSFDFQFTDMNGIPFTLVGLVASALTAHYAGGTAKILLNILIKK